MEFLQNFGDKNKDGKLERVVWNQSCDRIIQEWNDYYAAVSASIDNDEHFIQLMKAAWKLE